MRTVMVAIILFAFVLICGQFLNTDDVASVRRRRINYFLLSCQFLFKFIECDEKAALWKGSAYTR
jgi:hypothetical protein